MILAVLAGLLLAHTVLNAFFLRSRRPTRPSTLDIAVLLPVRDEVGRAGPCLDALRDQGVRVVVLDDGSTDGTGELVRGYPEFTLLRGKPLPDGWLGKPYACQQLADAVPEAEVLVFVDADVVLAPGAARAAVGLLGDVDLL